MTAWSAVPVANLVLVIAAAPLISASTMTPDAMANEFLPSSLPTVETLQEMISEEARMGWDYRPPLSSER